MVDIVAPYDRGETTIAALAVAQVYLNAGIDVSWYCPGEGQPGLDPYWDKIACHARRDQGGNKLRVQFCAEEDYAWLKDAERTRCVGVPYWLGEPASWQQFANRFTFPDPVLEHAVQLWPADRSQGVNWATGHLRKVSPSDGSGPNPRVLVFFTRRTALLESRRSLEAATRWRDSGLLVTPCFWQTIPRNVRDRWEAAGFVCNIRPSLSDLMALVAVHKVVVVPEHQPLYGAWAGFFGALSNCSVGDAVIPTTSLWHHAVTVEGWGDDTEYRVLRSGLWSLKAKTLAHWAREPQCVMVDREREFRAHWMAQYYQSP